MYSVSCNPTLFPDHIVGPATLSTGRCARESPTCRSHFGRFEFGGASEGIDGKVMVEVMGDLHRREGDDWVPTAAKTEVTADLEGVVVRVSWLEEETLAYIRRGRLERAAQCLPYCDHSRLIEVIRNYSVGP